jgi:hypothetical protein
MINKLKEETQKLVFYLKEDVNNQPNELKENTNKIKENIQDMKEEINKDMEILKKINLK